LFYDAVLDLEERYEKDKRRVRDIVKDNKITLSNTMPFDEFLSKISDHHYYEHVDEANVQSIFQELIEKALKESERTKAQSKTCFSEILTKFSITRETTWEKIQEHLTRPDILYLHLSDEEKLSLFESEMQRRVLENDFQTVLAGDKKKDKDKEKEREKEWDDEKREKRDKGRRSPDRDYDRKDRDRGRSSLDRDDRKKSDKYRDDDRTSKHSSRYSDSYSRSHSRSESRSPSPKHKKRRSEYDDKSRESKKYKRDK